MKKLPKQITACYLECVLMPQGEIICLGKTIGWFDKLQNYLIKQSPDLTKAIQSLEDN